MVKRANKKLWSLRRLKGLGAKNNDLIDFFIEQVRSILENVVQVWHPGLTEDEKNKIERVQKSALSLILGQNYKSYAYASNLLKLDALFTRRDNLCKRLAQKSLKHPKFIKWFKPQLKRLKTRHVPSKFYEVRGRTECFIKSPISFLTKILNNTLNN